MLNLEEVAGLASELGTADGLRRVKLEIDLLSERFEEKRLPFSHEELSRIQIALASLSAAIIEMTRIARVMLAEAGVRADNVG
jgi:hypothetical protein